MVGDTDILQKQNKSNTIKKVIDKHLQGFADEIFVLDAFNVDCRKEEIKEYLIALSEDVECIRDKRNPAAHA